ncbi:MAG: UDP-N-acetylmuramoyl-tripeptide--D-alanyl-D-alanine ligase [Holosporales bacterium]|nr:UDP-N-acetylmuramoyl-tripeptide--D-alanyl-D-alanine ligase [Holosporales bacterium]
MKITKKLLENVLDINNIPDADFGNISIDSRTIQKSDIFIAIKGKNFDGNLFAKEALSKGAAIAIIDNKDCLLNENTILVGNSLEFLKDIGKYIKDTVAPRKIIAITGSVGKTTTKTWLKQILSKEFSSFSSPKNYNTIYGLPISLSLMPENVDFGIFELGTNKQGEIAELSKYLSPDIGILTNIYEAHIGRFEDKNALAKEKLSLIDGIKSGGLLIYDGDSQFKDAIKNKAKSQNIKSVSVGFNDDCDFYIKEYGNKIALETPVGEIKYNISVSGKRFSYISATVIATLYSISCKIDMFLEYFTELSALDGRGKINEFLYDKNKIQIIDDSYNASPNAVLAAIEILESKENSRKIAVIGQMKDLGKLEEYYHKIIALKLFNANLDFIFFIGEKKLWDIFCNICKEKIICFEEINNSVIEKILQTMGNMSVVLLKGSRSVGLEKFIEYLK